MQAYVLAKVHSPICRANGLCWECNGNSVGKSGWAECERPRVNPAWGIQLPRKYLGNSEVPHGFFFFFFGILSNLRNITLPLATGAQYSNRCQTVAVWMYVCVCTYG